MHALQHQDTFVGTQRTNFNLAPPLPAGYPCTPPKKSCNVVQYPYQNLIIGNLNNGLANIGAA